MSPVSTIQIPGYELIRELGVGGMATVHLALQTSLDRKVALKVMRRNIDDAEKFEKRFLVEGRTLAKLPHRNIVAVYDIVKSESATYISMEYLEGGTLHDQMASGLSLGEAVAIVVQIAGALQFAHDHNVVHRDLKPANIMFRDPTTPVLTDFGIARQQDAQSTRLTQTGMLVGTPTYMSPEQINALEVDGRSDLYSLGVMFFELLTGKPPFQGDSPIAVLMAHLTTPPPPLPMLYQEFQPVLDRMLAKNREERFDDLREFTKGLKAVVVNNETLWSRLQADPNQSSSEQLRALGFSVSQTVGDALQSPGSLRRSQASLPGFRELPTQGGKLPGVSADPPARSGAGTGPQIQPTAVSRTTLPPPSREPSGARSRARPAWLLPGAIGFVAVLVLAIGWMFMRPGAEIDPRIKADVDLRLRAVDQLIIDGKLIVTDDTSSNALDIFRGEQARAPKYSGVVQRGEVLLAALKKRIDRQVKEGKFDDALIAQGVVASIWPDDTEIAVLPESIELARKLAQQAAELEQLLKDARNAQSEGRDIGPAGAYALLAKAASIAPADKRVRELHDGLMVRLLKPVEDELRSGNIEEAGRRLEALAPQLRGDTAWVALRDRLDQAEKRVELEQRLATLYARFDGEINKGQLTDPAADNALQTLEQIRELDATHPELAGRTARLADALVQNARRSLATGDASAALQMIDVALRVAPGQSAAMALKDDAEGQLSADQRRLVKLIGDARQALVDRRFVAPVGNNARELLDQVLRLDPQNADALAMRASISQRIAEAARALAEEAKIDQAIALVREARPLYPADNSLLLLSQQLDQQLAGAQREQRRRDQIERIQRASDQRPLVESEVIAAIDLAAALLTASPRDVDVLTARHRLVDALTESVSGATSAGDLQALGKMSDGYRARFASDPAAEKLRSEFARATNRVSTAENARIEASAGELILIAYPWGKVEAITDSKRAEVALPADATTPLQLRLPAGVYRVVFSHPEGGRSTEKMVQVKAGGRASVSASFAQLSAREYARRAGL